MPIAGWRAGPVGGAVRASVHFFYDIRHNVIEAFFLTVSTERSQLTKVGVGYQLNFFLFAGNKAGHGVGKVSVLSL